MPVSIKNVQSKPKTKSSMNYTANDSLFEYDLCNHKIEYNPNQNPSNAEHSNLRKVVKSITKLIKHHRNENEIRNKKLQWSIEERHMK